MANPLDKMHLRHMPNARGACFGNVRNGGHTPHQGYDIYAEDGWAVKAVMAGIVVRIQPLGKGAYGKFITIKLNTKLPRYAFYAHLSEIMVKEGSQVSEGDLIGKTGVTGNASKKDPHLHFELRTSPDLGKGLGGRLDPSEILGTQFSACNVPSAVTKRETKMVFGENEGMVITSGR